MNIALAIFRLVPAGGLERHAVRVAEALLTRGHRVTLYTTAGANAAPAGVEVVPLEAVGWSNHAHMEAFSMQLSTATRGRHDLVVGFQKLRGLDVLFCADWCHEERRRFSLARLLPRRRTLAALERACFAPEAKTRILLLSEPQRAAYAAIHRTPAERMTVLPPTVDRTHHASAVPTGDERAAARARLGLSAEAIAWLWIGLQPQVKGMDRATAALAKHPHAVLLVCGPSRSQRQISALLARARWQGFADRIQVLGMVPNPELKALFTAADLLVHPSRLDVTGGVILEAMAHGLPVVTTANCGFSVHVAAADAGVVLPLPFEQDRLDRALAVADPDKRAQWARNAFAYCGDPALYSGIDRACELIEAAGQRPGR